MVKTVLDTYTDKEGIREITFRYDKNNTNDKDILNKIMSVLREQPLCENCVNYQVGGCFCGYNPHDCKIHGNLDWVDHPHHDGDGSKCADYKRKGADNEQRKAD